MFFQEIEEVEEHIFHSKQDYDELQLWYTQDIIHMKFFAERLPLLLFKRTVIYHYLR